MSEMLFVICIACIRYSSLWIKTPIGMYRCSVIIDLHECPWRDPCYFAIGCKMTGWIRSKIASDIFVMWAKGFI
jgi:hypothetical protein